LPSGGSGYKIAESSELHGYDLFLQINTLTEAIQDLENLINEEGYELEYISEEVSYDDDLLFLKSEKEILLDHAVDLYVLEQKIDSAIIILANEGEISWTQQKIIQLNLISGNTNAVKYGLDNLVSLDIATSDFIILYKVLLGLIEDEKDLLSIGEEDIEILLGIAGKQSPSGVAAENILTLITGADCEEVFDNDLEEEDIRLSEINNLNIHVFPNPTSNELFVQISKSTTNAQFLLAIFDLTGKLLTEVNIESGNLTAINTTYLPNGILLIRLNENGRLVYTEKIIKQ